LDRAGWHSTQRLRVHDHVHLLFLPAYSPELQPAEHLWPLTNAPLINRHFESIEQLEEVQVACCATLQRQAKRIHATACFHWWPQRFKKPRGPK
jgi:transposase